MGTMKANQFTDLKNHLARNISKRFIGLISVDVAVVPLQNREVEKTKTKWNTENRKTITTALRISVIFSFCKNIRCDLCREDWLLYKAIVSIFFM